MNYHLVKFGGHRHCGNKAIYNFSFSHDLTRLRDQRVMWLNRQEFIKVNYHLAKFGGHKHCGSVKLQSFQVLWQRREGSEDMIFVCHVIL